MPDMPPNSGAGTTDYRPQSGVVVSMWVAPGSFLCWPDPSRELYTPTRRLVALEFRNETSEPIEILVRRLPNLELEITPANVQAFWEPLVLPQAK